MIKIRIELLWRGDGGGGVGGVLKVFLDVFFLDIAQAQPEQNQIARQQD